MSTTDSLKTEEREQLLQTIKMFEAIAETQPDDYRSLEILEDAYNKLGEETKALATAKRVAKAYVNGGLISKAIMVYEGIVQRNPKDAEAASALTALNEKMQGATPLPASTTSVGMATDVPKTDAGGAARRARARPEAPKEDPELLLGRFMVNQNIITSRQLDPIYQELRKNENNAGGQVPAVSLIEMLQDRGLVQAQNFLEMLIDKFRLPYIPLPSYDVDADVVKLVPRDLCFRHLVLPFDHLSRTLLLATTNPYARPHLEPLADKLNLSFQWYLSTPQEIKASLQNVYRLDRSSAKTD